VTIRVDICSTASEIARLSPTTSLPHFNAGDFESQRADLHLCALGESGDAQARCSLWWKETPKHEQDRVGTIGHYAAASDAAAKAMLKGAEKYLRQAGCTLAIGPMNGNTWRSYRHVTEQGDRPPFFLEPTNPPEWPAQFVEAGFVSIASYFSAINCDLSQTDSRTESSEHRMADAGVTIRSAHANLREELRGIYRVSRIAFQKNFLYTELPESDFAAMYEPVLPRTRPELVLIAEREGQCVGYLFAIPDLAQAARGESIDTFIIKTVAILPEPELRGLGSLLVARTQQVGHSLGFRQCIHALMFENNISLNISRHYASIMRKYVLYSKDLAR
jgi:GNAT superfamily N-acetyltransferase